MPEHRNAEHRRNNRPHNISGTAEQQNIFEQPGTTEDSGAPAECTNGTPLNNETTQNKEKL